MLVNRRSYISNTTFVLLKDLIYDLLLRFLADNRTLSNFQKRFFGAVDDKTRIFYFFDSPYNAAIRYDFVVDLKTADHVLQLLFLSLLGQDHKKIEDAKYEDKRKQCPNDASAAGSFLKKK